MLSHQVKAETTTAAGKLDSPAMWVVLSRVCTPSDSRGMLRLEPGHLALPMPTLSLSKPPVGIMKSISLVVLCLFLAQCQCGFVFPFRKGTKAPGLAIGFQRS